MENEKINKNAKKLIASDVIYSITGLFIETFLIAYFLQITNESIIEISIFYIIIYTILGLGSLLVGKIVKHKPNYNTKILSTGIILRAIFILFIFLLKEGIAKYFSIVAVLYGISEIFYWVVHESIYIKVTTNENRKSYMTTKKIIGKITNIVAPIILGSSIELYSFTKIAVYIFILSLIQVIISLKIKIEDEDEKGEKFNIRKFIKNLNSIQKQKINKYTKASIAYGIISNCIHTLVVIITVITFKTSLNLGILTSAFAICSMIALYIHKKYYTNSNSKFVLYLYSVLMIIGVIGLIIDINKITLIIYNLFYTTSIAVLGTIYDTKKADIVNECNIGQWNTEWIIVTELFIALGRVTGFILLLISGIFNQMIIFKVLLVIVTLFTPIYAKIMYDLEK